MKPKIKTAWIKALRSGGYEQTTNRLRTNNSFCCLGVLCNLHAMAHPKVAIKETNPNEYLRTVTGLPNAVMEWSGVDTYLGNYKEYSLNEFSTLADDNDSGKTFNEIADIIDKNF